jgi:hypothetical protein
MIAQKKWFFFYLGDIFGLASAALGGLTWDTDSRLSDTSASVGIR